MNADGVSSRATGAAERAATQYEYTAARALRDGAARARMYVVDGID